MVMSAHLDHVGVGLPINGDSIYNGAMDDASGIASLLEIAYPVFIILFTAIFLRKVHLNLVGLAGALLIVGGSVLVVLSRSK